MQDLEERKLKLEQKKNRLALEETRLRIKERKARTRNLIELGSLVVKAELDSLPINTLYGALLSLNEDLKDNNAIKAAWTLKGNAALNNDKQEKVAIILKFNTQIDSNVRELIREHGLMWNKFRLEWYGHTTDLEGLKKGLGSTSYSLEIID